MSLPDTSKSFSLPSNENKTAKISLTSGLYVQLEFLEEYPFSLVYGLFDIGHTFK